MASDDRCGQTDICFLPADPSCLSSCPSGGFSTPGLATGETPHHALVVCPLIHFITSIH